MTPRNPYLCPQLCISVKRNMPAIRHQLSCNRRFVIELLALLLSSLSVAVFSSQAHADECCETARTENIAQRDGLHRHTLLGRQGMPAGIVATAKHGERISCSRPVRQMPTGGGTPLRMPGFWTSVNAIHLSNLSALLLLRCNSGVRAWAASSRLHYVIALRRILC